VRLFTPSTGANIVWTDRFSATRTLLVPNSIPSVRAVPDPVLLTGKVKAVPRLLETTPSAAAWATFWEEPRDSS